MRATFTPKTRVLPAICAVAAATLPAGGASKPPPKAQVGWTDVFNGKDLSGWTTHLPGLAPNHDPKGVFRVVRLGGENVIRVSGEGLGGLTSEAEIENYHLTLEFKWGQARHPPRQDEPRDSGLLYHASGGPRKSTGWLESLELGILEGGETGDFYSVPGPQGARIQVDVEGDEIPIAKRRYRDQPIRFRAGGPRVSATTDGVLSTRDYEKPRGQWNRLDLFCLGQTAVHVVNGRVAMVLTNIEKAVDGILLPHTRGKIQLQSEGAETYYRKVRYRPLAAIPEVYRQWVPQSAAPNTLTDAERAAGWRLLFDGKSMAGWRGHRSKEGSKEDSGEDSKDVTAGWRAEGGTLALDPEIEDETGGHKRRDLMTVDKFGSFELAIEWRLTEGGNSGIYYFVDAHQRPLSVSAPEYELRDNRFWPEDPYRTGGNYGLHKPTTSVTRPVGQWNHTRIVARGAHVEHWLNGRKVVEYDRGSPRWIEEVAASKFRDAKGYGRARQGHILLQNHGSPLAFRNIKIRRLPLGPTESALPVPRPGWTVEQIAGPPTIKHPSVVEVAPDGRVFVAEDPMDISAPRADMTLGRIVCLHPDGRVTVFADGLHAVFGMMYLEGKLFVLHNPKLSVFDDSDDGVGRNRRELIASTNPEPWASGWNDHVPANFRLAMDGYIYWAVGDKGLWGATGRDGRRVDMAGGGIARLRPDGTGLEVFATGARNIMDVAIDAADDLFTYDNTDEQQWMSRLTHMVDGGFYGYPHDFVPRRPYTLWMMADYGGGAATGTLAYEEDALPEEFRGNLFLADFGKRQILRVPLAREGGSFRAVFREELFPNPPSDFRPVGIAVTEDGAGLYICDWNHTDTKDRVEVGRLLKLKWAGPSGARPRPKWYMPAAMGKPFKAEIHELVAGLSHPARGVRLVAQRRLSQRGASAARPLQSLLADGAAPRHARWHALWALDALGAGQRGRTAALAAARDRDSSLRIQAFRLLGLRRVAKAAPLLTAGLRDGDAAVRLHAATALGRLGLRAAVPDLISALAEPDLFARFAAFTALRRIGLADGSAWQAIVLGLEQSSPRVREGVVFAIREVYDAALVAALVDRLDTNAQPEGRALAVGVLAGLHKQRPAWTGAYWGTHPVNTPQSPKSVPWAATGQVLAALKGSLDDRAVAVRRAAVEGLLEAGARDATARLWEMFHRETDADLRAAALAALASARDERTLDLVISVLSRDSEPPAVRAQAITAAEAVGGAGAGRALVSFLRSPRPRDAALADRAIGALGRLRPPGALEVLAAYTRRPDETLRRHALMAIAAIGGPEAPAVLVPMLADPSLGVKRDTIAALGALRNKAVLPNLLAAHRDPDTRAEAALALARTPDVRALDAYLDGLAGKNADLRAACDKAIRAIGKQALATIEARVPRLSPEVIATLQDIFDRSGSARQGPLFAAHAVRYAPADYLAFVLETAGDAAHGKQLFGDARGLACIRCHRVGAVGGEVGPDLSTIGAQAARPLLAESILYPSRMVREGYNQVGIEMADGIMLSGIVRGETNEVLTVRDAEGNTRDLPKTQIKDRQASDVSLMPEGLHAGLSLQDFSDLVAYLESLR